MIAEDSGSPLPAFVALRLVIPNSEAVRNLLSAAIIVGEGTFCAQRSMGELAAAEPVKPPP